MTARIKQLRSAFAQRNIDALLVNKDANITYLTGFPASESWLLITSRRVFFITDSRYILEARKGLKGISIKQYTKSITETLYKLIREAKVKKIGIDEQCFTHAICDCVHNVTSAYMGVNQAWSRLRQGFQALDSAQRPISGS